MIPVALAPFAAHARGEELRLQVIRLAFEIEPHRPKDPRAATIWSSVRSQLTTEPAARAPLPRAAARGGAPGQAGARVRQLGDRLVDPLEYSSPTVSDRSP